MPCCCKVSIDNELEHEGFTVESNDLDKALTTVLKALSPAHPDLLLAKLVNALVSDPMMEDEHWAGWAQNVSDLRRACLTLEMGWKNHDNKVG